MSTPPVHAVALWAALLLHASTAALAADPGRGAQLFLQLSNDTPSCVSCHGADPAGNRNNLLRAADQPSVLVKTLGTVSAMGYLRSVLSDADVADLAAYFGAVARLQASPSVAVWPLTVEFGTLAPGSSSAVARVVWRNRSGQPVPGPAPQVAEGRFLLDGGCRGTVPPGGTCEVQLRALAGSVGDLSDVLRFDGDPAVWVGLSAQVHAAPAPVWVADVDTVDFGRVESGLSAERTVVLRNAGTAPGTLIAVTLTGEGAGAFSGQEACSVGVPVLPGQSCTLRLRFQAGTPGPREATLQWRGDGILPPTLRLRGEAVAAAVASPPDPAPVGGGSGGGGCASAPAARTGDALLLALCLAACGALGWRRRRPR